MHDTKEEERRHRQILTLGGRLPVAMVAACPFPANRGTPIRVQQMGEALVDLGYDVHVVTYHIGTERPLPGMTVHRTRPLRFYQDFSAGPNYAKLLLLDPLLVARLLAVVRKHGIRIIHAHHFEGALCALAVKRLIGSVQVIYDAHTSLKDELLDYSFRVPKVLKKLAADILDSGIPRWSDHVVTVSDRLGEFIAHTGVPSSKITVIPMGVNAGEFPTIPTEEARAALGLTDEPTVVYTGNLAPFQGVDHLLRSFTIVTQESKKSRLIIVGRPTPGYQRMVDKLGIVDRVTFAGERPFDEVRTFLAAADVVVLPRDNCVGFPLKLLNYMAAGKAIVAFEGGSGEVLNHLENGYVVPDGDENAFARGILNCLSDTGLSATIASGAHRTANRFDLDAMVGRIGRLYDSLELTGRPHYANARA
ncbi:MAG: glycosyltransferase family 4 protein [Planctomycetota bacterium]|nr:glycosyltransferase family 4 protein [Planctomycetota bacterium]